MPLARRLTGGHGLGDPDTVHSRGGDPTRISGPLAAGVEAMDGGLAVLLPEDAHRRGGAGFHAGEKGAGVGEPPELSVKEGQGAPAGWSAT